MIRFFFFGSVAIQLVPSSSSVSFQSLDTISSTSTQEHHLEAQTPMLSPSSPFQPSPGLMRALMFDSPQIPTSTASMLPPSDDFPAGFINALMTDEEEAFDAEAIHNAQERSFPSNLRGFEPSFLDSSPATKRFRTTERETEDVSSHAKHKHFMESPLAFDASFNSLSYQQQHLHSVFNNDVMQHEQGQLPSFDFVDAQTTTKTQTFPLTQAATDAHLLPTTNTNDQMVVKVMEKVKDEDDVSNLAYLQRISQLFQHFMLSEVKTKTNVVQGPWRQCTFASTPFEQVTYPRTAPGAALLPFTFRKSTFAHRFNHLLHLKVQSRIDVSPFTPDCAPSLVFYQGNQPMENHFGFQSATEEALDFFRVRYEITAQGWLKPTSGVPSIVVLRPFNLLAECEYTVSDVTWEENRLDRCATRTTLMMPHHHHHHHKKEKKI